MVVGYRDNFLWKRGLICSVQSSPWASFSLTNYLNLADLSSPEEILSALSALKLGSSGNDSERSDSFWNAATVAMKFSVERLWLDAVWKCKSKPNYGMRDLDAIFEERVSNKFELTGSLYR